MPPNWSKLFISERTVSFVFSHSFFVNKIQHARVSITPPSSPDKALTGCHSNVMPAHPLHLLGRLLQGLGVYLWVVLTILPEVHLLD